MGILENKYKQITPVKQIAFQNQAITQSRHPRPTAPTLKPDPETGRIIPICGEILAYKTDVS
jgi:hypothetical protein